MFRSSAHIPMPRVKPPKRESYLSVVWDNDGRNTFMCFAAHSVTGEILMIYSVSGTICAKPFGEHDIFDGLGMPENRRFSFEEVKI